MPFCPGLPAEIVDEILDAICDDCTRSEFHEHYQHDHPAKTFASLCLTSRLLNEFATKRLYRRPSTREWWLLARTLITRPDLAVMVNDLDLDYNEMSYPEPGDIGEEVQAWYLERMIPKIHPPISKPDNQDDDDEPGQYYDDYGRYGEMLDGHETLYDMSTNAAIDMIAGLCPNIVTLQSAVWYMKAFTFCKPDSLLSLKHIKIFRGDVWSQGNMDIGELQDLFRAAPNLESVHFVHAGSCWDEFNRLYPETADIKLEKVTRVFFWECGMPPESFRGVLGFFPNAERIRYGYCGYHHFQFKPQDLWDMVTDANLMKNIKEFSFWYDGEGLHNDWEEKDFEHLERAFERRGINFEHPYKDNQCVKDLL
ncbi:hypothetical protein QBC38DRAFT_492676 [Podospora fimiseda]|uniref:Uncharacterized protein n=1 Tax=Podospora fimiseda TaxID=252190 RepID=A0AAN6YNQ1_9PEZI|nr:hypothetical protein QBC38DRAFT_492676 [Podospora fimiseda]